MVNTILKEADLFCPNSVRINFTIYHSPLINQKIVLTYQ
ncbi:ABC transporter ATP-binding protein (plasmid) [Lactiplantibacillus plantarum]|nr:ABC transporter ATP-binding protein [Lactiplantibacillus plantarum]RWZ45989.1 ABC transporter ATP-binding protein [Lactiplantibacillus plantarum]